MPAKKAYKPRRRAVRKPVKRRGRKGNTPDMASLSCKTTLHPSGGTSFSCNTMYNQINTALATFPRAVLVAQGYQHYRMSKVALTFKPTLDAFQPGGGQGKPSLYYMIDKSGSLPLNTTLEALKNMGARPRALDEKPITVAWRPSVLTAEATNPAAVAPASYKMTPWLSTNANIATAGAFVPSSVDHWGLYWYADSYFGGQTVQYTVEIEVQFQFKKPYFATIAGPSVIPCVVPALDGSSDGVADGRDHGNQVTIS